MHTKFEHTIGKSSDLVICQQARTSVAESHFYQPPLAHRKLSLSLINRLDAPFISSTDLTENKRLRKQRDEKFADYANLEASWIQIDKEKQHEPKPGYHKIIRRRVSTV